MNSSTPTDQRPAWTWADQISTYRFWGLIFFNFFVAVSASTIATNAGLYVLNQAGIGAGQVAVINLVRTIAGIYGFFLAWAAARWHSKALLFVMAGITLIGAILMFLPGQNSSLLLRSLGAFLMGLAAGALTLITPALIAGGRGGTETFVITLGLIGVMSTIDQMMSISSLGFMIDSGIPLTPIIAALIIIGCIFLAPVKGTFFTDQPNRKGDPIQPESRNPWTVGLLCLVPFVYLYWLYRFHGEATWLAPARDILTPFAAVLGAFFVPFLVFVMPVKLIDSLNAQTAVLGMPPLRKSWVIFLWSIFFFPVAFGMLQSAINQLAAVERSYADQG